MQQYIGFRLEGSEYTIPIHKVREIINTPAMTRLPQSPDFMKGIINLRGRIVPVIDLRELVSGDRAAPAAPAPGGEQGGKIIVVARPGSSVFGMLVDSITSVVNIEATDIESAAGLVNFDRAAGVARLDDRLLILLDTDMLVAEEEMDLIDRELAEIQKAADVRKLSMPQARPAAKAAPAPQARPAAPPSAPPAQAPRAAAAPVERVTVKEIRDASDMLKKTFSNDDSRQRFLSDLLKVMDAMATRDMQLAEALMSKIMHGAEGDLYNQIGHVTRKLHNSMKEFRRALDPRIRRIADEEVPQAVDSLEYVIKKTEEAANRTLAFVEKHQASLEVFDARLKTMDAPPELAAYLQRFHSALREDLNDIMLAQDFQDITGQTIRRVIDLVNAIEAELIGLIATFGVKPELSKEAAAKPTSEKMTQDDIEGLLDEFGF